MSVRWISLNDGLCLGSSIQHLLMSSVIPGGTSSGISIRYKLPSVNFSRTCALLRSDKQISHRRSRNNEPCQFLYKAPFAVVIIAKIFNQDKVHSHRRIFRTIIHRMPRRRFWWWTGTTWWPQAQAISSAVGSPGRFPLVSPLLINQSHRF